MSAHSWAFTMRAEVRRNIAATDAHGHPGSPSWELVKDGVPCFVWNVTRSRLVDSRQVVEVEEMAIVFSRDADVRAFDRIEQIKDKRDRVLFAGPFDVLTGTEKSDGKGVDHLFFKARRTT